MTKRISLLLAAVVVMTGLIGCGQKEIPETTLPTQAETKVVSVKEETTVDGIELLIDTQVNIPDMENLEQITLTFDDQMLETMEKELVHSQYPGLKPEIQNGDREWQVANDEQLLFSFGCTEESFETGRVHYLDVLRNLNGQDMGNDALMRWTPNYMTDHVPDRLDMTAEEAGEEIALFLERYSCFDYVPWNVIAVNCQNVPDSSGYYQTMLQPEYADLPVYIDGVPYVSACLSEEGVFTFQGMMVLKEQNRTPAESHLTLEEAVTLFKSDFSGTVITNTRSVTVNAIKVGYVADAGWQGIWTLSPAWVFEYSSTFDRQDGQGGGTDYYTCAYRMKDGYFWNN